jgi:nitrite reductase/ring-hydroxylating ferredoxin subunit
MDLSGMTVVAAADDITPGQSHLFELEGVKILLVRVGDTIHATSGWCTHARTVLGPFELADGQYIECPSHGAIFDPSDGARIEGPTCAALPVYAAQVDDRGMVRVALPMPEEQAPPRTTGPPSLSAWFQGGGAETSDQRG